ncbi:MAG: HNH endonuclease, partial [Pseudonocardiales bacterium]
MSLDESTAAKVEQAVLAKAPEQSLASFRRSLRKAVLTAAPQSAEQRHERGLAQRRVVRMPADDTGMSGIWMLLPDAGATMLMTAIDALARRVTPGDPRTADQRRADAVIQLALDTLHGTDSAELPREHGMRPTIHVTVALSTLLDLDEEPGELAGSGPIPAALARKLAADPTGTWRRLVTDPLGKLIDYGHTRYKPPKHLAEHV